ncbi:cytochrome P450 2U1-like [Glandiceps talaboti]
MKCYRKHKGRIHEMFADLADHFGPVFCIKVGRKNVFVINGNEAVKDALVGHAEAFAERPSIDNSALYSGGVAWCKYGEIWKLRRRFTMGALRYFFGAGKRSLENTINVESRHLVHAIKENNGKPFDMRPVMHAAVANILFQFCTGKRFDYADKQFCHMLQCITRFFSRPPSGFRTPAFLRKVIAYFKNENDIDPDEDSLQTKHLLEDFIRKERDRHQLTFDPNDPRDIIDLHLLEMKQGESEKQSVVMTDDFLVCDIFDLLLGGSDTTSQTMMWIILYLVTHVDLQTTLQKEMDAVIGKNKSPSLDDRSKLPLTEAAISEVLRLSPTAPLGLPHSTSDDVTFRGYAIPKGSLVFFNIWSVHHEADHWSKPGEFKPDRFLNSDGQYIRANAFMPFGTGKRLCLGEQLAKAELFLFVVNLLQRFDLRLPDDQPKPTLEGKVGALWTPQIFQVYASER